MDHTVEKGGHEAPLMSSIKNKTCKYLDPEGVYQILSELVYPIFTSFLFLLALREI